MKKANLFLTMFTILLSTLISCSSIDYHEDVLWHENGVSETDFTQNEINVERLIDKSTVDLSSEDAKKLAFTFRQKNILESAGTRAL